MMISPMLLMLKYPSPSSLPRPDTLYINLLLSHNQKYPYKQIKRLKRYYSSEQSKQRFKLLWDHYYRKQSFQPSTLTAIKTVSLRRIKNDRNFDTRIRQIVRQFRKRYYTPADNDPKIERESIFMTESLKADIQDLFVDNPYKTNPILMHNQDKSYPFPRVAQVKNKKKKFVSIR